MKLECSIRIEDLVYPEHSFKRFVNCNLYVGILKKSNIQSPQLYVRTANSIHQYQIINNVQCIRGANEKNFSNGKATVGFRTPRHYLMINCEDKKLLTLLRLLCKVSNREKIAPSDITISKDLKKPTSKPKTTNISNISSFIEQFRRQYPSLWGRMTTQNLQKLELKDVEKVKLPVMLGQLPLTHISLINMALRSDDLLWLNELEVRSSLKTLCLSNNKLTEFPTAVIDCLSLYSLDLSHNAVRYIPHGISRLQKLRILQLSHNHLYCLPADITSLKLQSVDLAFNRLYSNIPVNVDHNDRNIRGRLQLEDWAALNVDPFLRFQLTTKDCPNNLLRKLRSLSRCLCDKVSPRYPDTAFYVPLGTVKFSASSWIEPQSGNSKECSSSVYLQYHFCIFRNNCTDRKFRLTNCFRLVNVTS